MVYLIDLSAKQIDHLLQFDANQATPVANTGEIADFVSHLEKWKADAENSIQPKYSKHA